MHTRPQWLWKNFIIKSYCWFEDIISGSILKDGVCITNNLENTPVQNREMGMVFQDYALFPNMDIKSNIAWNFKIKQKKRY